MSSQNVSAEYFIPTLPRQNRFGNSAVETRDLTLRGRVACVKKSTPIRRCLYALYSSLFFFFHFKGARWMWPKAPSASCAVLNQTKKGCAYVRTLLYKVLDPFFMH